MNPEDLITRGFEDEVKFIASRSSGAGGQNVNKVNTKIELRFNILDSQILTDEEKQVLLSKLATRLTNDNILIISSQEARSQLQNKELALGKLYKTLSKALTVQKKRRPTKPSASSKEKRLESKRKVSVKKELRKKIE